MFEPAAEDTWTTCAFVVLVVIIGFGVYRRINYVKQTSSIYANLLRLNSRYHFHGEILREYRIDEAVPAK